MLSLNQSARAHLHAVFPSRSIVALLLLYGLPYTISNTRSVALLADHKFFAVCKFSKLIYICVCVCVCVVYFLYPLYYNALGMVVWVCEN